MLTISIGTRVDATLYERIKRIADSRYEGRVSMVVRAAIQSYLQDQAADDEEPSERVA